MRDVRRQGVSVVGRCCIALLTLVTVVVGCTPTESEDRPPVVDKLITELKGGPKKNPPASIWKYNYKGLVVFYVPPSCCDLPSALYDSNGNFICAPDGGITGDGDGKCPDFIRARNEGLRLWVDKR